MCLFGPSGKNPEEIPSFGKLFAGKGEIVVYFLTVVAASPVKLINGLFVSILSNFTGYHADLCVADDLLEVELHFLDKGDG